MTKTTKATQKPTLTNSTLRKAKKETTTNVTSKKSVRFALCGECAHSGNRPASLRAKTTTIARSERLELQRSCPCGVGQDDNRERLRSRQKSRPDQRLHQRQGVPRPAQLKTDCRHPWRRNRRFSARAHWRSNDRATKPGLFNHQGSGRERQGVPACQQARA